MRPTVIDKPACWPPPNLTDLAGARAAFSWAGAQAKLEGLPGGALNMAHEAVFRHAAGSRRDHVALRWIGRGGERRDISYGELAARVARFCNVLRGLGVQRGDRVFALCGRVPELYVAALGTLTLGAVFSPLFSAFGPEPIRARLAMGHGRVLITTDTLYRNKVQALRASLPDLRHILLVGPAEAADEAAGVHDLERRMAAATPDARPVATAPDEVALLHFTSGTTGKPKGALHVHQAIVAHHATAVSALDLRPDDVFWCTADPGWVTGTSYGIFAPLSVGATLLIDEGEFDAARWLALLGEQGVDVWYTAPTAVRMMMRAGATAQGRPPGRLRFIASVGEPLNPEAVFWGLEAFGLPIHDNWWQTETGGIMIANFAALPIRPGSMGLPVPGIEAGVVRRDGDSVAVVADGEEGELALRPGWPSMFRGYLDDDKRTQACFAGGWYLSGDLARRDRDGYFWFVGRSDDVIKSAGHLIGPFEVESALLEHPAVAEAAAIGVPDPVTFERVKAFVSLRPGHDAGEALRRELLGFARKRLGASVAPKEIDFLPNLPRTRSGKILRRLLKARELGLPEGDTSTLEAGA